ncbi:SH2 domain-containing protein 7 [Alligator sinensis]|uniref:SH2 domain-containing protein 7 n=1 Tax=Alligator sinensis TaxID=38654 RepID=A0A3Q0H199_ALLSI|nr:SH2 domain-containing protein 7 [Alligator sinensis]XP_025064166.1 SH2 domain-containing protein 7 [Alligator sinensis]XP_025064167.1 SH2 domain-containing protein 7 [Alligator sinensis]XP_025064168.1 SH2 domain-containing protein 7 [Alligator sinensis]
MTGSRFILHDRMENKHQQLLLAREANTEIENQSSELLKDLALKWFMDTQAPLLLQNGTLPEWFHGFITRKQTEDLLTDKDLGCFLIRLSDKAVGYILSYRGKDRCRHFVINYLRNGHYVVSGDTCTHESLADLIEYYQTSEIEPFGENLMTACTQRLEKSVYDEISWDQQTSSKQSKSSSGTVNPLLIKQVSGSLPTTVPKKDTPSSPAQDEKLPSLPPRSKKTLQEQQRNLSGEKKHFSHEDLDMAPPLPDRSSLLMPEILKHDLDDQGTTVYAMLNKYHLSDRDHGLETHSATDKVLSENPGCSAQGEPQHKPGELDQASYTRGKKISTVYAVTKQTEHFYSKKLDLTKPSPQDIVYSEVNLKQDKCHSSLTQGQGIFSLPFPLSTPSETKLTLSAPASMLSKLSKLPNKAGTSMESQGSEQLYATSLHFKGQSQEKITNSLTHITYGQTEKVKSSTAFASGFGNLSNTYEQIPIGWSRSSSDDLPSEKISKSPLIKADVTYDQVSTLNIRSFRTENHTDNSCEKTPEHCLKGSSAKQVPGTNHTHELISMDQVKGAEAKSNLKMDKRRRFFFPDKKNKS